MRLCQRHFARTCLSSFGQITARRTTPRSALGSFFHGLTTANVIALAEKNADRPVTRYSIFFPHIIVPVCMTWAAHAAHCKYESPGFNYTDVLHVVAVIYHPGYIYIHIVQ